MDGHTHSASNSYVGSSYDLTGVAVGKKVWFNYEHWRCVHIDGNIYYLILETIKHLCDTNSSTYKGSRLAALCTTFQNDMTSDSLALCVDTTVNGVTAKVFIPSYEQCTGEFTYFTTQANRIAYLGGQSYSWWTSSLCTPNSQFPNISSLHSVTDNGSIVRGNITIQLGFRPCVAVTL